MKIYFCREFVRDLSDHGDPHFASRVLAKILSASGGFEADADDHRFNGIENAWIRYVSRGTTGYRAIFLRRDGDIYWYRAGLHAIEDRLRAPQSLLAVAEIGQAPEGLDLLNSYRNRRYLKTSEPRLLREVLASRILVPHRSVTLVTPRISPALFSPLGLIGRLIAAVLERRGVVSIITKPPSMRDLTPYRWLVSRGVDLLLHNCINARLLIFEVDRDSLDQEMHHITSIGIIGSSDMTEAGLGMAQAAERSEELCYEIAEDDLEGSNEFALKLAEDALSLEVYLRNSAFN